MKRYINIKLEFFYLCVIDKNVFEKILLCIVDDL